MLILIFLSLEDLFWEQSNYESHYQQKNYDSVEHSS